MNDRRCLTSLGVIAGLSRPKDGVASLAYDPAIHERVQRSLVVRIVLAATSYGPPGQARG
jgi:hypothetical protein